MQRPKTRQQGLLPSHQAPQLGAGQRLRLQQRRPQACLDAREVGVQRRQIKVWLHRSLGLFQLGLQVAAQQKIVLQLFLHLMQLQQDQFGFFAGVIGFGLQLREALLKLGIRL